MGSFPFLLLKVFTFSQFIRFARVSSHVIEFNARNKILTWLASPRELSVVVVVVLLL